MYTTSIVMYNKLDSPLPKDEADLHGGERRHLGNENKNVFLFCISPTFP